jgi:hypothetical protein
MTQYPPTYQQPNRQTQQPRPRPTVVQVPVPQDSGGVLALRCLAYVLTSLASLLFIALVAYGYVQFNRAQTALEDVFGGGEVPTFELPTAPPAAPLSPGG